MNQIKNIYQGVLEGDMGTVQDNVQAALDVGVSPADILHEGLIAAMGEVGRLFEEGEYFVPEMLIAARAMKAGLAILKPLLVDSGVKPIGKVAVGTVKGDLHDIGKNLVAMMVEGGGWTIVDLGVDVSEDTFNRALTDHPGAIVGLSALLTTTMANMEEIVRKIKEQHPETQVLVGGAPLNDEFRAKIGADFYSPDPRGAVEYLKQFAA